MIDYKMPNIDGIRSGKPVAQPRCRRANYPHYRLSDDNIPAKAAVAGVYDVL